MRVVVGKRVVPVVALMFLLASCKTTDPTVDAASSTVPVGVTSSSTTTTTEEPTTTSQKRFFSTSTDPDAPTTEKPSTTRKPSTTSKSVTTRKGATTTASPGYTEQVKASFIKSCLETSGGVADYCNCVWDEITATITFDRFREIERELAAGASAGDFPELTDAVASCKDRIS
jgi:hypothetical protein